MASVSSASESEITVLTTPEEEEEEGSDDNPESDVEPAESRAPQKKKRRGRAATQVVISQESHPRKARRVMQLEKRLRKQVVSDALKDNEIVGKKQVADAVYLKMIEHGSWRINGDLEEGLVRQYVWDKGLTGWSNAELAEELCGELGILEGDLVRVGQVKTKVSNVARVPRDIRKMIERDDSNDVGQRLVALLKYYIERHPDGEEVLATAGVEFTNKGDGNGRAVE